MKGIWRGLKIFVYLFLEEYQFHNIRNGVRIK
jgi:hypothetical protein